LIEIAQDCACLVDAKEVNEIRRGMKTVLEDKIIRQNLIAKGRKRVEDFTWDSMVKKFITLLK